MPVMAREASLSENTAGVILLPTRSVMLLRRGNILTTQVSTIIHLPGGAGGQEAAPQEVDGAVDWQHRNRCCILSCHVQPATELMTGE
jgi:hypothetical protein